MIPFDARNWFWIVASDESRAWSSAVGAYVIEWPSEKTTHIASDDELSEVLRPYGLAVPRPTEADYSAAIQAHVDAAARSRSYADGVSLASYAESTIPQWAAEATAFIAWRDDVWAYAYGQLAKVRAGQRVQPSVPDLLAELPAIDWPSA